MTALLEVKNIQCNYGNTPACEGISFSLEKGDLACLLGPSGCGKTTVLRAIAGFHKLETGSILLNGKCVSSIDHITPPEKRNLGMVFQDHALFPHLNIAKNISSGLWKKTGAEQKRIITNMLKRVGLTDMHNRYPHELSGGQQQRVALARALAPQPSLLLMDEPFSNLDLELREKLAQEVHDLLKDTDTSCIMVTHDQQDAFTFGGKIGIMSQCRIQQWDSPYNLYHKPANRFVADFIGEGVLIDGTVKSQSEVETELAVLNGDIPDNCKPGSQVKILVRPDDIIHDDNSPRTAQIKKRAFRGESYLYTLELASGQEILSMVPSHHDHCIGEALGIKLEIDHLVIFPTWN